ncbi:Wall-associated receptor kinase 2 [Morella rubra]|uniref:Wall-associated receptor kinase 2 n=1 Tax=Morella rubra TaxID=262757 RepID=A0A6A1V509_9ROSI|nr:Wall-associated receptor kinase 2 [Morella rubra]
MSLCSSLLNAANGSCSGVGCCERNSECLDVETGSGYFCKCKQGYQGNPYLPDGCQAPTFLYGAAHEEARTLDSIRRKLGYFKPNSSGTEWAGGPKSVSLPLKPDEGPTQVTRAKGVVVIGATPWVDNYNVPVFSNDMAALRRIAKRVSGRGGGLPSVQAMALAHGNDVTEVACNLLEPNKVGGDRVQQEVERLAREEGMAVGKGYFTDLSQEEIVKRCLKLGSFYVTENEREK